MTDIAAGLTTVHRVPTESDGTLAVRCSAGLGATTPGDRQTADVMRRADLAMYAAKSRPAQRLVVFDHSLQTAASRKHLLTAAISGAADRGELHLCYQPIHRLIDQRLVAAEALLRWTHPDFGAVGPDEFIPLAEETGQIDALGDWVLRTALGTVAAWQREGLYLPRLLVNVSSLQFDDPRFPDRVAELLERVGLPATRLTLEVTETQLSRLAVADALHRLQEIGTRLAIDDFGAGYSNLARLSRLPVEILKIDRELVSGLDRPAGRDILRAVVALGETLGMTTVAEGIETPHQREAARECDITWGQGYLFDRPLLSDQLATRLPQLRHRLPQHRRPVLPQDVAAAG